jgi:signal transduction histidine kinase
MEAGVRISRKVAALVAVPLAATLGFAALAVYTSYGQADRAEDLRRLVLAGAAAGELVHWLQLERGAAVVDLTGGSGEPSQFTERVTAADAAADDYLRAREQLASVPSGLAGLLTRIDGELARLSGLRDAVAAGEARASVAAFTYRIVIADLLSLREQVGQAGGAPAEVADRLRAAAALSQATEATGLELVAVLRARAYGPLTQTGLTEITAARTANVEALATFDAFAEPAWRAGLERSAVGPEALAAQQLQDAVARTAVGDRLGVQPEVWTAAMSERMGRQRLVETGVDADILERVTRLRDGQRRAAAAQIAAVGLAALVAVGLAVALGGPVVRGLRRLRDAAHEVAYERLPEAVTRLEQVEDLGGLSPEQFADGAPVAVRAAGRDEVAEVASAFNAVHRAAIRVAAEQALTRLRTGEMFVNLARRGQGLAGRLTTAIDELERPEEDPERLKQLFQVDLLVTLLSRVNDSLLVLGGRASAQVRLDDESLSDVIRAAGSRVEKYQQWEAGWVDDGVAVRAGVVDDVVLLLALLLDNAVRYSPQLVRVDARLLHDRVVFQIVDEGVGIPPQKRVELNRRLASRPPLDVQAVQWLGTTVAAMLAHRHGMRVELRESRPRGTIAEVMLPIELVAVEQRVHRPAPPSPAPPADAPVGRPAAWPPEPAAGGPLSGAGRWDAGATQELRLPIYDSVQRSLSLWFDPPPRDGGAAAAGSTGAAAGWATAADKGWRAAARAAEPEPDGHTSSGLPRRRPSAQLVPGGVEHPPAGRAATAAEPAARWRDPARAGLVAAAYARGLATRTRQAATAGTVAGPGPQPDAMRERMR